MIRFECPPRAVLLMLFHRSPHFGRLLCEQVCSLRWCGSSLGFWRGLSSKFKRWWQFSLFGGACSDSRSDKQEAANHDDAVHLRRSSTLLLGPAEPGHIET